MAGRIAYVDESIRPRHVWLAVVIVRTRNVPALRKLVRSLHLPGQRQLHIKKESDPRRRAILSALTRSGLVRARVYRAPRPVVQARAWCLAALVGDLAEGRVPTLVLDRVDEQQVVRDRHTIREAIGKLRFELQYRHAPAWEEAGVQAADAAAWAYGVGGDWRRRVRPIVDEMVDIER